jgi:predicted Zn-dependent protease
MTTTAWQRIPELRLASMNLMELRDLARALRLWGYSSLNREQLTASLLRKIQARRGKAL